MIVPQKLTPPDLVRLIYRYNFGWCTFGAVLLVISLGFWAVTIYLFIDWYWLWELLKNTGIFACLKHLFFLFPYFRTSLMIDTSNIPLQKWKLAEEAISILMIYGIAGIVLLNPALFFATHFEADFPASRKTLRWELASPSWITFPLTILCLAPILTILGFAMFWQCFSLNSKRITLACRIYTSLNDWGDWAPYPKFESQRQAVLLLYQLGLVRISRRFGTLQVKVVGGKPKRFL